MTFLRALSSQPTRRANSSKAPQDTTLLVLRSTDGRKTGMATSEARNAAAWTPCQVVNPTAARSKTRKIRRRKGRRRSVRNRAHWTGKSANNSFFSRLPGIEIIVPAYVGEDVRLIRWRGPNARTVVALRGWSWRDRT